MTLRCVIVDDSPAVLRAARELLDSQGLSVVGVAATGDEAILIVEALAPDVVLIDIDLGAESGFDLARRLAPALSGTRSCSILISTHDEADFANLIAARPALGFIAKSELSASAIRGLVADAHDEESDCA
jgi:DNA-binding NarL/FixJ family response regulator